MAWSVSGQSMEICSCNVFCPCWLSAEATPDQGWCSGVFAFDVQQGNSDGVDLGGTKVIFIADWPGNFWDGGARVVFTSTKPPMRNNVGS